jgi:hypothetical protein
MWAVHIRFARREPQQRSYPKTGVRPLRVSALETTKEKWLEAEAYRMAGEIARLAPEHDAAKTEAYFDLRSLPRVSSRQRPGNCARR